MEKLVQQSIFPLLPKPASNATNLKRAEIVILQYASFCSNMVIFLMASESLDQSSVIHLHFYKNGSRSFGPPLLAARFYLPFTNAVKSILESKPPLSHNMTQVSSCQLFSLRIQVEKSICWQASTVFLFLTRAHWCHESLQFEK